MLDQLVQAMRAGAQKQAAKSSLVLEYNRSRTLPSDRHVCSARESGHFPRRARAGHIACSRDAPLKAKSRSRFRMALMQRR